MSTDAEPRTTTRRAPMIVGLLLLGLGATAAMTAQTGLSFAQSGSIWLLVCAVILLMFLLGRGRPRPADS